MKVLITNNGGVFDHIHKREGFVEFIKKEKKLDDDIIRYFQRNSHRALNAYSNTVYDIVGHTNYSDMDFVVLRYQDDYCIFKNDSEYLWRFYGRRKYEIINYVFKEDKVLII